MDKTTVKPINTAHVISDGTSGDKFVIGADLALSKSKTDATKRMSGSALCLAVPADDGQYVSVLDKEFVARHPGRGSFVNALALIGAVEKNAVVFHDLGNGMYWVAAVRGGVPLPGCDLVTTHEEGDKALGDYFEYVPDGVLIGSSSDSVRSVETVLKRADAKKRLACVYKKPKSPYLWLLVTAGVALLIIALVVVFQSFKVAREAAELARQAALSKLNESARIDAAIAQYNEDVRKVVEKARAEIAVSVPVSGQVAQWLDAIEKQPLHHRGFRLDAATCDITACKFIWKALPRAALEGPDTGEVIHRDDTAVTTSAPLQELVKISRLREERLALVSRVHQIGTVPGASIRVATELAAVVVPTPSKPNIPPEMQAKLAAIQPVTVGHQAAVDVNASLSFINETVALVGNSVSLRTLETTPLTSATGAALVPQFKLSGFYVRLP